MKKIIKNKKIKIFTLTSLVSSLTIFCLPFISSNNILPNIQLPSNNNDGYINKTARTIKTVLSDAIQNSGYTIQNDDEVMLNKAPYEIRNNDIQTLVSSKYNTIFNNGVDTTVTPDQVKVSSSNITGSQTLEVTIVVPVKGYDSLNESEFSFEIKGLENKDTKLKDEVLNNGICATIPIITYTPEELIGSSNAVNSTQYNNLKSWIVTHSNDIFEYLAWEIDPRSIDLEITKGSEENSIFATIEYLPGYVNGVQAWIENVKFEIKDLSFEDISVNTRLIVDSIAADKNLSSKAPHEVTKTDIQNFVSNNYLQLFSDGVSYCDPSLVTDIQFLESTKNTLTISVSVDGFIDGTRSKITSNVFTITNLAIKNTAVKNEVLDAGITATAPINNYTAIDLIGTNLNNQSYLDMKKWVQDNASKIYDNLISNNMPNEANFGLTIDKNPDDPHSVIVTVSSIPGYVDGLQTSIDNTKFKVVGLKNAPVTTQKVKTISASNSSISDKAPYELTSDLLKTFIAEKYNDIFDNGVENFSSSKVNVQTFTVTGSTTASLIFDVEGYYYGQVTTLTSLLIKITDLKNKDTIVLQDVKQNGVSASGTNLAGMSAKNFYWASPQNNSEEYALLKTWVADNFFRIFEYYYTSTISTSYFDLEITPHEDSSKLNICIDLLNPYLNGKKVSYANSYEFVITDIVNSVDTTFDSSKVSNDGGLYKFKLTNTNEAKIDYKNITKDDVINIIKNNNLLLNLGSNFDYNNDWIIEFKPIDNTNSVAVYIVLKSNYYDNGALVTNETLKIVGNLMIEGFLSKPDKPDGYSDSNIGKENIVFVDASEFNMNANEIVEAIIINNNTIIEKVKEEVIKTYKYYSLARDTTSTTMFNYIKINGGLNSNYNENAGLSAEQLNTFRTDGKLPVWIDNSSHTQQTASNLNNKYNLSLSVSVTGLKDGSNSNSSYNPIVYFYNTKSVTNQTYSIQDVSTIECSELGYSANDNINSVTIADLEEKINNYIKIKNDGSNVIPEINITDIEFQDKNINITYNLKNKVYIGDNQAKLIANPNGLKLSITNFSNLTADGYDESINTNVKTSIQFTTQHSSLLASSQTASSIQEELISQFNANQDAYFENLPRDNNFSTTDKPIIVSYETNDNDGTINVLFALKRYIENGIVRTNDDTNQNILYQAKITGFSSDIGFANMSRTISESLFNNKALYPTVRDGNLINQVDFKLIVKDIVLSYVNTTANCFDASTKQKIISLMNAGFENAEIKIIVDEYANYKINGKVVVISSELAKISNDEEWLSGFKFTFNNLSFYPTEVTIKKTRFDITLQDFNDNPSLININDVISVNNVAPDAYAPNNYTQLKNVTLVAVGNDELGIAKMYAHFPTYYDANNKTMINNFSLELQETFEFIPVEDNNKETDKLRNGISQSLLVGLENITANKIMTDIQNSKTLLTNILNNNKRAIFKKESDEHYNLEVTSITGGEFDSSIVLSVKIGSGSYIRYETMTINFDINLNALTVVNTLQDIPSDLNSNNCLSYFSTSGDLNALAKKFISWNNETNGVEFNINKIYAFNKGYSLLDGNYVYVNFVFERFNNSLRTDDYYSNYVYQIKIVGIPDEGTISDNSKIIPTNGTVDFINYENSELKQNSSSDNLTWLIVPTCVTLICIMIVLSIVIIYKTRKKDNEHLF